MNKLIKYGVFLAAGVGIFEVLRRTGALQQTGDWLSEQVPDDVKSRVRKAGKQVREGMYDLHDHIHDAVAAAVDKATNMAGKAAETAQDGADKASNVVTELANGVQKMTEDSDGASLTHRVGRGIVH